MKHVTGLFAAYLTFALCGASAQQASAPARAAAVSKVGVVTKIDADAHQIVLKMDAGGELTVDLQGNASFRRVAPGETDLTKAAAIALADVSVGDRVLARGRPSDDQKSVAATLVVVMSQSDIAKKQAAERADWDRRGVTGLVTAASPDRITITVRGADGVAKPMIIVAAENAIVRRYAPDSVKFVDAKKSSLAEIKAGDQVRARGTKSDDGGKLTADEIVSGSFRMLAGLVLSIDAQENQVRINNLETKKPMVVKVNPDSSVHKLPPPVAQMLAARLHGGQPGADGAGRAGAGEGAGGGRGQGASEQNAGASPAGGRDSAGGGMGRGTGGGRGGGRGGDVQSLIERAPSITLADLKNGDAIIVSSTVGASADQVTAITVLAGVEPILTKPGTREMSLGQWNMDVGDMGQP